MKDRWHSENRFSGVETLQFNLTGFSGDDSSLSIHKLLITFHALAKRPDMIVQSDVFAHRYTEFPDWQMAGFDERLFYSIFASVVFAVVSGLSIVQSGHVGLLACV